MLSCHSHIELRYNMWHHADYEQVLRSLLPKVPMTSKGVVSPTPYVDYVNPDVQTSSQE